MLLRVGSEVNRVRTMNTSRTSAGIAALLAFAWAAPAIVYICTGFLHWHHADTAAIVALMILCGALWYASTRLPELASRDTITIFAVLSVAFTLPSVVWDHGSLEKMMPATQVVCGAMALVVVAEAVRRFSLDDVRARPLTVMWSLGFSALIVLQTGRYTPVTGPDDAFMAITSLGAALWIFLGGSSLGALGAVYVAAILLGTDEWMSVNRRLYDHDEAVMISISRIQHSLCDCFPVILTVHVMDWAALSRNRDSRARTTAHVLTGLILMLGYLVIAYRFSRLG